MRDLCVILLILIISPWFVGIGICLWRYFSNIWDKVAKWTELKRNEKQVKRLIKNYGDWYTAEENAIYEASIYDSKYKRSQIFTKDDLKIWKAFI